MFEGLNWKAAARRSAIVIGIYIGLFYVLSVAFPKSFGLDSSAQVTSLLINALVFFFVFTFVYAFIERSRTRRLAETKKQQASKPPRPEGDPGPPHSAHRRREPQR